MKECDFVSSGLVCQLGFSLVAGDGVVDDDGGRDETNDDATDKDDPCTNTLSCA